MFHKILGYIAALIVILASLGVASLLAGSKKPPEKKEVVKTKKAVAVYNAQLGTNSVQITMDGKLEAFNKIELYSEVGGRILKGSKDFKEGVNFRKGETLLSIDSRDARAALVAQRSSFQTILTQILSDIKLDYNANFKVWNEYLINFEAEKAIPDLPKPASDKEKRFLTTKNIYNTYYNIKSQELKFAKYRLSAPFNGVLTSSNIQYGSIIRPGQKLGDFIQPSQFELKAPVNVKDISFIKVGDDVKLSSSDMSGEWSGKITRISNNLDPKTQSATVFVAVNSSQLKEGMYLSGEINAGAIKNSMAIARKLLNSDNSVFVVDDGKLKKVFPKIEKMTASNAIVSEIPAGAKLLTQNFVGAYEGLEVNIASTDSNNN